MLCLPRGDRLSGNKEQYGGQVGRHLLADVNSHSGEVLDVSLERVGIVDLEDEVADGVSLVADAEADVLREDKVRSWKGTLKK